MKLHQISATLQAKNIKHVVVLAAYKFDLSGANSGIKDLLWHHGVTCDGGATKIQRDIAQALRGETLRAQISLGMHMHDINDALSRINKLFPGSIPAKLKKLASDVTDLTTGDHTKLDRSKTKLFADLAVELQSLGNGILASLESH